MYIIQSVKSPPCIIRHHCFFVCTFNPSSIVLIYIKFSVFVPFHSQHFYLLCNHEMCCHTIFFSLCVYSICAMTVLVKLYYIFLCALYNFIFFHACARSCECYYYIEVEYYYNNNSTKICWKKSSRVAENRWEYGWMWIKSEYIYYTNNTRQI